ncbi:SH2 domain-containing protein 6 isoform X1 [Leucoraja erinacea]|uniref:SH2 domain-containing protein 6 isoform X1 n=1 Tax=Leucoraja erinaceus TaxID=7782 RepID=UPI0024546E31|nr:SH2 domain-containing protein 6 isoform X1 [Leucoraja erinacea]
MWSHNEPDDGCDDGDTYEPPPIERPMITPTPVKMNNNSEYVERAIRSKPVPSIPITVPKRPVNLPKDDDDGEYLELDIVESRGSKNMPDPRPLPTLPRGVQPHPQPKLPVPIGKALPPKPPLSPEEAGNPPLLSKRMFHGQSKYAMLVPTPFIQSGSFTRMPEDFTGNISTSPIPSLQSPFGENANLQSKPWFTIKCDRKAAEVALHENGQDGAFLVRHSSGCNEHQPYTLAVLYGRRVYNIPIRFNESNNHYILGKEKAGEKVFKNLPEMIEHYQQKSLVLINEQNQAKDPTLLLHPVRL